MTINKVTVITTLEVETPKGLFRITFENGRPHVVKQCSTSKFWYTVEDLKSVSVEERAELYQLGWKYVNTPNGMREPGPGRST